MLHPSHRPALESGDYFFTSPWTELAELRKRFNSLIVASRRRIQRQKVTIVPFVEFAFTFSMRLIDQTI
jgi:hypothetical protein